LRRAALVAVALFLAASALPHVRFFQQRHESLGDVLLYQVRGNEMLDGQIPYHDFFMEYPPGALPVFVLPAIRGKSEARYALYFKLLLAGLGAVALTAAALILTELGAERWRLYGGLALVAVSPALLGPVFYLRYDLWPAALTVVALAALVSGRDLFGLAVLAVAAAAQPVE
jgi:hypothetical protein